MMSYKIIKQRKRSAADYQLVRSISAQLDITPLTARLLIARGIDTLDKAEAYLNPRPAHLYDPFLMKGMAESVARIKKAIAKKEKITVVGDYDCDGVCAVAILFKALKRFGADVSYIIPDRFADGYGLNASIVDRVIRDGTSLMITVDNGITAVDEIKLAQDHCVDVILTDHHSCPDVLPGAFAIIDPKQPGDKYPFNDLCGAGIALKLAFALGDIDETMSGELFAIAAVATVADVVSLKDENRIIASLGISYIKKDASPGIKHIIEASALKSSAVGSGSIAFQIAPRINSAGRLQSADCAVELFVSEDEDRIKQIAQRLNETNEERKLIEEELTASAERYIKENDLPAKQNIFFIPIEDAHDGVIGIVAGRLAETYLRPVVVGSCRGDEVKASARSIPSFNLYDALSCARELYIKFGGHSQAAGFSIKRELFKAVALIANKAAKETGISSLLYKRSRYDIEATLSQITRKAVSEFEKLAPFGTGNPKPVIFSENLTADHLRLVGSDLSHVNMRLQDSAALIPAVGFHMPYIAEIAREHGSFDVLYAVGFNTYKNNTDIQLEIKDFIPHIPCPEEYYISLYKHFHVNLGELTSYVPEDEQLIGKSAEECVDSFKDAVFIVYGKDMLMRVLRYSDYNSLDLNLSYQSYKPANKDINILVNPTTQDLSDITDGVVVLDPPCFCGYEKRLYGKKENVRFLKSERYNPEIQLSRDYIAFIYKKLNVLGALGNSANAFIDYLNTCSDVKIDLFKLLIILDILSDIDIIDYELNHSGLFIELNKLSEQKDINDSQIMIKLKGFAFA